MSEFGSGDPLRVMPDGTVKQLSLLSGVQVWTVPSRADRPVVRSGAPARKLAPGDEDHECPFCPGRIAETPPEKARRIRTDQGWRTLRGILPGQWHDSQWCFRRIPNLFEIVGYDYWARNYAFRAPNALTQRCNRYCADSAGRLHVEQILRTKQAATGEEITDCAALDDAALARRAIGLFAGGHDVIVARRHFVDGATDSSQLAGSGTLSVAEHAQYMDVTIEALHDLYEQNRHVRYVAVFQNWLRAAGASFDHVHKQLVSIDERPVSVQQELARLRANPNAYNDLALNVAVQHDLVIAENAHAIAFAGFGHRYPTIEIYSKSAICEPWAQTEAERADMSALVHACHAGTGTEVASNEEWHHRSPDMDMAMPWRINLKWRISTLAGFEGDTKIYVNTLDPWHLRDRLVASLTGLRDAGRLGAGIAIGDQCPARYNSLRYNPQLRC
ncbi:Galactose-1-phosphate uridylyltransferase [Propionibacterium cyclohexanicum]|uniref:Galactose-1-phosphate uridylyltransferase n=1 Tax=Propionibacterium cyclohexanicum TaxID=64702 RepID=A0A1H9TLP1_9ACTN|nr:DUF4921 family protein [Propionibacterium cyclohexanicum]SER98115.1 Galactose-1-phosphate uridylyltransferase [Propionibacterium cyclohexanicum]